MIFAPGNAFLLRFRGFKIENFSPGSRIVKSEKRKADYISSLSAVLVELSKQKVRIVQNRPPYRDNSPFICLFRLLVTS